MGKYYSRGLLCGLDANSFILPSTTHSCVLVHGGVLFVTLIYLEVCISIELSDKKRSIMVHALLPH